MADQPIYDPITPEIATSSICNAIVVRGYAEPKLPRRTKRESWQPRTRPASWFEGEFIVIDTETVDQVTELSPGTFQGSR